MNNSQKLLQLVEHFPELEGVRIERPLSSGPLSEKWLLASDAGQWVLRLDKPLAGQLDLDRQGELEALEGLVACGWFSDKQWGEVIAAQLTSPARQQGMLLVPYLPGRAWTEDDIQQPDQLGRFAALLQRLHSCATPVPPFRLDSRVNAYARHIGTAAAAQSAENIHHMLAEVSAPARTAVCHNDPVAGNVVDDGKLQLIDFEFAAAGDPLFDLAAVIEHHRLSVTLVDNFTAAYRQAGGTCDMRLLEEWRMIYSQAVGLWNQVVAA